MILRRGPAVTAVLILVFLAHALQVRASPLERHSLTPIDGDFPDCDEDIPEAWDRALDYSKELHLRVHYLVDNMPLERGQEIAARVTKAYERINISITSTFDAVAFTPDTVDTFPGLPDEPAYESTTLRDSVDEYLGGTRPEWADVVYTMTGYEIPGGTAGWAECIGGIRWPTRAFAFGEANANANDESDILSRNVSAKIAAHEIAHLLGAHHHYSNCAEADVLGMYAELDPSPCTMMFPDVGFSYLTFSTLEARVSRGFVDAYAQG